MAKARITYRFDREGRPEWRHPMIENGPDAAEEAAQPSKSVPLYEGEYRVLPDDDKGSGADPTVSPVHDSSYLNQFTTDFGAWSSPFDAETEKLEKLIRDTDRKEGPKLDAEWDKPSWSTMDAGRSGRIEQAGYGTDSLFSPRYTRRTSSPWRKLASTFLGAVATGAVLGFIVLSVFSGGEKSNTDRAVGGIDGGEEQSVNGSPLFPFDDPALIGNDSSAGGAVGVDGAIGEVGANGGTDIAPSAVLEVNGGHQTFYVLQNGLFSSAEGSEIAQQALRDKGFAAAQLEDDGRYFVYAGILTSRDDALWFSHQLQEQEFEVYINTLEIPAVERVHWEGGQAEQVSAYLAEGDKLALSLIDISSLHLQRESPVPLEAGTLESIRTQHQLWSGIANPVVEHAPLHIQAIAKRMNGELNTAVVLMEEYSKNASSSYQWQAQTALMNYMLLKKQLLTKISLE